MKYTTGRYLVEFRKITTDPEKLDTDLGFITFLYFENCPVDITAFAFQRASPHQLTEADQIIIHKLGARNG